MAQKTEMSEIMVELILSFDNAKVTNMEKKLKIIAIVLSALLETSSFVPLSITDNGNSSILYSTVSEIKENEDSIKAFSAIIDVINNKKEYYSNIYKKNLYLKDFHSSNFLVIDDNNELNYFTEESEDLINHSFTRFCIADLNYDGKQEILLESHNSNIFVFHYEKGIVYGDVFPYRGMLLITTDSLFQSSGGASINSIAKIKFVNGKCKYEVKCIEDGISNIYQINDKNVSKTETKRYFEEFREKEQAVWYEYSDIVFIALRRFFD